MKKFWKATLIPGICCILAGTVLAIVLALGFADEIINHQDQFKITNFFRFNGYNRITREGNYYDESETKESYYFAVPEEKTITGICFEFAAGEVNIKAGDKLEISVTDMFEDAIRSEVRNGIWYVEDSLLDSGSVHWGYSPDIEITIPESMKFENIEIYIAAGTFYLEELNAEEIILEVDAGSMKVMKLTATEQLELTNGVGEMDIYEIEARNLVVDNGVGSISLSGAFSGHNVVTCGVGEVEMKLTDRRKVDFNYVIECGIGEVEIDDVIYGGTVEKENFDRDNADSFELNCGIGRIELDIAGY